MPEKTAYVIIHGSDWSMRNSDPHEYVAGIVYGVPVIRVVLTDGKFVALCEYESFDFAKATMERMGSFSYGSSLTFDKAVALREFGAWVYHGIEPLETAQSL